jgi:tripartite-type tricarboxylate transporter receptor subunit TctC
MASHRACLLAVAFVAAAWTQERAFGQDFPTRPVRIIVPYAPGGGTDITSRIVQERTVALLGQPLVIENRAGGGTLIGTQAVANAAPDGYTLGVMDPAFVTNPQLMSDARYDPLKDFAPVSLLTVTPLILIVPSSFPARTVQELIDYAKVNPGKLNFGSPGSGSGGHLAIEQFRHAFGLQINSFPIGNTPDEFAAFLRDNVTRLGRVVRESNIKSEP